MNVTLQAQAIEFLNSFFQQYPHFAIRLQISEPGTMNAKVSLDMESLDSLKNNTELESISVGQGLLFYKISDKPYMQNFAIGYKSTLEGGELELDLPFLYGDPQTFTLLERVQAFFTREIQPALAVHKGQAVIKEITDQQDLIIAFSGGCQGCSMASLTLKNIIDRKVQENFPQIRSVIDATNHDAGENPYA